MSQFSVDDAMTKLSKLIASALEGEDVVIARGSVPVLRLSALVPTARRSFGALKGRIAIDKSFNDPPPDDELAGSEAG